jgi:hypothetical protein
MWPPGGDWTRNLPNTKQKWNIVKVTVGKIIPVPMLHIMKTCGEYGGKAESLETLDLRRCAINVSLQSCYCMRNDLQCSMYKRFDRPKNVSGRCGE